LQGLDAEKVKEWRHRRMLSQQEVADRAGTSLFTVQRIERGEGNVRPKTGRGLAAALGVPIEELLPKAQAPLFRELPEQEPSEERRDYGSNVWERINLLEGAAEQWQRFIDEGRYDLKRMDLEDLKAVDNVSLRIVLDHAPVADMMKHVATDEQRTRLEQAERRLIDTNLEFWAHVEDQLAREKVPNLNAFRKQREKWNQTARNSRTA
jgi:transcriptional regulator with XRE-family HTH domain